MTLNDDMDKALGEKKKKVEIDLVELADRIVKEYKLKAIIDRDTPDERKLYIYNDDGEDRGIWTRAETFLMTIVKKYHPDLTLHQFKELLFNICTKEDVAVGRHEFDNNPWMIHFNNGWFNLKTWSFQSHDTDRHTRLSLVKSKVKYDPDTTCPVIDEALKQTLSEENKELYLKMVGYCFLPTYAFKKAFVLIGPKDSGKTVFKELIGELVGWNNVSAVAWSDIEKPYMAAELDRKMVNLASEITKAQLLDIRIFKMLTGDDSITARKIREAPFTFKNRAKMIIAVNDMPEFGEVDEAAIGRIIIIDFDRQFSEKEIDANLLTKMSTPEELSGLLNHALKGLKQVFEDNGFNEPDLDEKVAEYKERVSDIRDFIEEMCEFESLVSVPTADLMSVYSQYCLRKNKRPLGEREFGKELLSTYKGKGVTRTRPGTEKRQYVYNGIRLKSVNALS